MKCKLIEKKLIFYIENELDATKSELVKAHLDKCSNCQFLYQKMFEDYKLIDNDKLTEINPFFHTRVMEKIKKETTNKTIFGWIPKKQYLLQTAFYMVLGVFALFIGTYLGSENVIVDETSREQLTDTTDYQLFANSHNYNFNKNVYLVEIGTEEE